MQYDDGYVAYLNGVEVAYQNAPSSPAWNSVATEQQDSEVQATTYENVDLTKYLSPLTSGCITTTGTNVLAIQVLLALPTDPQMLCLPESARFTVLTAPCVFSTPTPAAANAPSYAEPSITFSTIHGYFTAPFPVTLTTNIPGGSIYYTTDNSVPTATNGTLYTGPITINTTTVLQAATVVDGVASAYQTQTYIFAAAVATQSNTSAEAAGFPTAWTAPSPTRT